MRAVHIFGLLPPGLYQFAILGMTDPDDVERLQADVEAAVETFYRGWRPDPAGQPRCCPKRRQFRGPSLPARPPIMLTRRRGTRFATPFITSNSPGSRG